MATAISAAPTTKFTPDDLLRLPDQGKGFELVNGEIVELNVSTLSSYVSGQAFFFLLSLVRTSNVGWVFPEGTSFRCFPGDSDRVWRADAAFIRRERLSDEKAAAEGHCTEAPDLVVEVVSPNDLADDVNAKRIEWQEAGVRLVWVIHPHHQTIHAYHADGTVRLFRNSDTLTADPVLPGFKVHVADLFRFPPA
jgi:Uma2 family endonuclease